MTHWLISANTKLYNHYKSFKDHGFIDWKMSSRYHVGDIVYVYSSMPIQKIQYKTVVEEINMRFSEIRDDREYWKDLNAYNIAKSGLYARFRLLERIDGYELSIEKPSMLIITDIPPKISAKQANSRSCSRRQ